MARTEGGRSEQFKKLSETTQFANLKYNDFLSLSGRWGGGGAGQEISAVLSCQPAGRHWTTVSQSVMSGMFQVCQGTCLCAPSPEGYGKGKVLYCYGEVRIFNFSRIYWNDVDQDFRTRRILVLHDSLLD